MCKYNGENTNWIYISKIQYIIILKEYFHLFPYLIRQTYCAPPHVALPHGAVTFPNKININSLPMY